MFRDASHKGSSDDESLSMKICFAMRFLCKPSHLKDRLTLNWLSFAAFLTLIGAGTNAHRYLFHIHNQFLKIPEMQGYLALIVICASAANILIMSKLCGLYFPNNVKGNIVNKIFHCRRRFSIFGLRLPKNNVLASTITLNNLKKPFSDFFNFGCTALDFP